MHVPPMFLGLFQLPQTKGSQLPLSGRKWCEGVSCERTPVTPVTPSGIPARLHIWEISLVMKSFRIVSPLPLIDLRTEMNPRRPCWNSWCFWFPVRSGPIYRRRGFRTEDPGRCCTCVSADPRRAERRDSGVTSEHREACSGGPLTAAAATTIIPFYL